MHKWAHVKVESTRASGSILRRLLTANLMLKWVKLEKPVEYACIGSDFKQSVQSAGVAFDKGANKRKNKQTVVYDEEGKGLTISGTN